MNLKNAKEAIEQIAKKEGISVEKVRTEIEYAIKDAYNNPKTHQEWVGIFGEGNLPTPEEFLCIMTEAIKK